MPGVPKSRGCEACRKQRKKCDIRETGCSRCVRLGISCSGAGVQRFIFIDRACARSKTKQPKYASRAVTRTAQPQILNEISPNVQESMTALMVNKLSIKDLRYNVGWAFGPFVSDIPRRLGRSIALDNATQAFVLSLPPSPQTRRQAASSALESFTAALKATRLALADPIESRSIDTLCAAYLLLICQDRIGAPEDIEIHVLGIANLLNSHAIDFDSHQKFDVSLVMQLCSIISAERIFDPHLATSRSSPCWSYFNGIVAQNKTMGPFKEDAPDLLLEADLSRSLESLYVFLHDVKSASDAMLGFAAISSTIKNCRDQWHRSCALIQSSTTNPATVSEEECNHETLRVHLRVARSYCIALTLGLIMNTIVQMYHPNHENALAETSRKSSEELVSLAKQASRYKPLGGTFLNPFLNTVWGLGDWKSRAELVAALELHQIDFDVERAMMVSKRLRTLLGSIRCRIASQSLRDESSIRSPHSQLSSSDSSGGDHQMPEACVLIANTYSWSS